MSLEINFWNKFYASQESNFYVEFNYSNRTYFLNKNVNLENKHNYFSIGLDIHEILNTKILQDLENFLKTHEFDKINLRVKPNIDKFDTSNLINFLKSHDYFISMIDVMIVDLRKDINELRSKIRKSYKSLINKEEKKLEVCFSHKKKNLDKIFNDWKKIYSEAILRGGKKISDENFELLRKALIKNQCIISICYEKNQAVGGMLFSVYEDYLFYSSSVRVSEVEKDKKRNIHHFLMWTSIVELKKRYKFLELGTFYKISDENDKLKVWSLLEEKFNKFKLGFSPDIIKTIYFYKSLK